VAEDPRPRAREVVRQPRAAAQRLAGVRRRVELDPGADLERDALAEASPGGRRGARRGRRVGRGRGGGGGDGGGGGGGGDGGGEDRKSTRLNSSHVKISYAVFCWEKKRNNRER